ncbi:MAG: hypothetical protein DHS20C06_10240 [Hyphobacterium sp.]|nr:MAG: hypothetical protein DHS20C06_10240 [Hyphobacterium sp.]
MNYVSKTVLTAIAVGPILSAAALCQSNTPAPPPTCSSEEYRQLDFWVGNWHAEWDNGDGTIGQGENHITRDEFGDCVVYERFTGPGLNGMSVSTFFAPASVWRQAWVDDQGGFFSLIGGPDRSGEFDFVLNNARLSETAPHRRMVWDDVSEGSFTWLWQGRANSDEDWADLWVINYTRMEE